MILMSLSPHERTDDPMTSLGLGHENSLSLASHIPGCAACPICGAVVSRWQNLASVVAL